MMYFIYSEYVVQHKQFFKNEPGITTYSGLAFFKDYTPNIAILLCVCHVYNIISYS